MESQVDDSDQKVTKLSTLKKLMENYTLQDTNLVQNMRSVHISRVSIPQRKQLSYLKTKMKKDALSKRKDFKTNRHKINKLRYSAANLRRIK